MFKFLYKEKDKRIDELTELNANLRSLNQSMRSQIKLLESEKKKGLSYIEICKQVGEDNLPESYLPTSKDARKAFLGELSRLNSNKHLKQVIDYTINLVASYALRGDIDYSIPRAKYVIEGIESVKEQINEAEQQLQKMIEEEKPITDEENEELIKTSIEEVLNNN